MAAKGLRAVADGEKPPSRARRTPAKSVAAAAKSGNQRQLLEAMRDRIASAVTKPDCPPRDLASLTRRLQDIAKEIAAIDARAKEEQAADADDDDNSYDASAI